MGRLSTRIRALEERYPGSPVHGLSSREFDLHQARLLRMVSSRLGRDIPHLLALLEVSEEEVCNYPVLRDKENSSVILALAALADSAVRIGLIKEVI